MRIGFYDTFKNFGDWNLQIWNMSFFMISILPIISFGKMYLKVNYHKAVIGRCTIKGTIHLYGLKVSWKKYYFLPSDTLTHYVYQEVRWVLWEILRTYQMDGLKSLFWKISQDLQKNTINGIVLFVKMQPWAI